MSTSTRPFLILIVIDGFGCRKEREHNAIAEAEKPCFDRLLREMPWTTLDASGAAVGLPDGQMGNSEVGHLSIGAGRVIDQDIVRISKADLTKNGVLAEAVQLLGAARIHRVILRPDVDDLVLPGLHGPPLPVML